MKKFLGVFVLGAMLFGAQNAEAVSKNVDPPAANKANNKAKPASKDAPKNANPAAQQAQYMVRAVLSHNLGQQGQVTIFKLDSTGTYQPDQSCEAIGGNPEQYPGGKAMETPASDKFKIYDRSEVLRYNGAPDEECHKASYFIKKPSAFSSNEIAFHTASKAIGGYTTNSHGCVRTPCAPAIYNLPIGTPVQVSYE